MNLLKIINLFSAGITILMLGWAYHHQIFITNPAGTGMDLKMMMPGMIAHPLLLMFSVFISFKGRQNRGSLLFALFLILLNQNYVLGYIRFLRQDGMMSWIYMLNYVATATLYIKSFQYFPRRIGLRDAESVFGGQKILGVVFRGLVHPYSWIVMPVLLMVIGLLTEKHEPVNIGILLIGALGLFVNYRLSDASERNKILWLFWGLLTYIFLRVIRLIALVFNTLENSEVLNLMFSWLSSGVLVLSVAMSLFFSDTFNTGILIRRTLVNGVVFIFIILIYNTVEHYFLHWISHVLGLSDVLLASLLSGFLVLVFSPLHHRLIEFLQKKIKKEEGGDH